MRYNVTINKIHTTTVQIDCDTKEEFKLKIAAYIDNLVPVRKIIGENEGDLITEQVHATPELHWSPLPHFTVGEIGVHGNNSTYQTDSALLEEVKELLRQQNVNYIQHRSQE